MDLSNLPWKWVLAIAVVAIVGPLLVTKCYSDDRAKWERRIEAVTARNELLKMDVLRFSKEAREAKARADTIVRIATQTDTVLEARTERVREETPDSLVNHPAILKRDSLIDDWREQSERWREAFYQERARAEYLLKAKNAAVEARDSLRAVLDSRPGERPWWVPRLSVGPQAGVDRDWDVEVQFGVQLGWEIKL